MADPAAPFRLSDDVRILGEAALPRRDRQRMDCKAGDVVVTRRFARARSKVIGPDLHALLELFRAPRTIVEAISILARTRGVSPATTLEAMFPALRSLINDGFLIQKDDGEPRAGEATLAPGQMVGEFEVSRCLQLYDDTEVYRALHPDLGAAALKIVRRPDSGKADQIDREAAVLKVLGGSVGPRLLSQGQHEGRTFLTIEWVEGLASTTVANRLRHDGRDDGNLLRLCEAVVTAYADLHAAGAIHGDVHPGNVLVGPDGRVTLIDFGYARLLRGARRLTQMKRAGVGFFFEPEFVASEVSGATPRNATPEGEQYAVAALVYALMTGRHYLDFSYDQQTMYAQILRDRPRSFAEAGVAPRPAVEAVLGRALEKSPAARFADMTDFAAELRRAGAAPTEAATVPRSARRGDDAELMLLLSEVLGLVSLDAPLTRRGLAGGPTASVHSGASGVAYGLLRIACAQEDPMLLAAAGAWSRRAMTLMDSPDGYLSERDGITPDLVGEASIAHSPTGTAFVHALVAGATGDISGAQEAVDAFVTRASAPCAEIDLFAGRAGHLHACAQLLDSLSGVSRLLRLDDLEGLGEQIASELLDELTAAPPVGHGGRIDRLGAAHGWSGLLLAQMEWTKTCRRPAPDAVLLRLEELTSCGCATGAGLRWPVMAESTGARGHAEHMSGWCNGGAGHVLTYLLGAELFAEPRFLEVAERGGREALADKGSSGFLCCGNTGVAYAMLALHRATGDRIWSDHAHRLAHDALQTIRSPGLRPTSLFRGALGLAVLAADLAASGQAFMPIFGPQQ